MARSDPHVRGAAEMFMNAARRGARVRAAEPLDETQPHRRTILLSALGAAAVLLTGCSSTSRTTRLPDPTWRDSHSLPDGDASHAQIPNADADLPGGVIPRSQWALGAPVPTLMNMMRPVRYITVHHDGSTAFYASDTASSTARLESIRRGHRGQQWGDIGYHFAVDRAGRVFQCRPLSWQGAHVKDHNDGNIGVVNLGNFDLQTPTEAQVRGLQKILVSLQAQYRVPVSRVRTHQEWAATACPGRSMQHYMNTLRSNGQLV